MKPQLIHCSYHKCLTVYYYRVMAWTFNRILRFSDGYRHFNSRIDDLYAEGSQYRVASLNNQALDLSRLADCRITRFVRDPRDLIVSGYFYHRRGAEPWCNKAGATEDAWAAVNGSIPIGMRVDQTFSDFLREQSLEDGLMAEMQFRKKHLESMLQWPVEDHRIRTFRYEQILGDEQRVFSEIFDFYEMSWIERKLGMFLVNKFSAKKQSGAIDHIRNPSPGQWKDHFTPKVERCFNDQYAPVLERYGYDHS